MRLFRRNFLVARAIVLLALAVWSLTIEADLVLLDDAGRRIHLSGPAQRIISLAPHATEMLFAVGAGSQLVGVSEISNYPEAARHIQAVASGVRLDIERILALKPDLVVGWKSGNTRADLDRLASLHVPIFIAEPKRLDELPRTLEQLGRASGHDDAGRSAAEKFRNGLAKLRDEFRNRKPVWVFLQISNQPLMTLNHSHMATDVLLLCGGRNLFAGLPRVASDVSLESILVEDPDVILYSEALGSQASLQEWWKERGELRAVRTGRLYPIPSEQVLRQTPRLLQGARRVCETLDQARKGLEPRKAHPR